MNLWERESEIQPTESEMGCLAVFNMYIMSQWTNPSHKQHISLQLNEFGLVDLIFFFHLLAIFIVSLTLRPGQGSTLRRDKAEK